MRAQNEQRTLMKIHFRCSSVDVKDFLCTMSIRSEFIMRSRSGCSRFSRKLSPKFGRYQAKKVLIILNNLIFIQFLIMIIICILNHSRCFSFMSIVARRQPFGKLLKREIAIFVFIQICFELSLMSLIDRRELKWNNNYRINSV